MKAFVSNLLLTALTLAQDTSTESNAVWNYSEALVSHELSLTSYCGMAEYQTHNFSGAAEGFVVTKVIYDKSNDIEGYVGYLPSNQSIYVVFRGTESLDNWLVDFDAFKTKYEEWPECDCEVHAGFYKAVKAVRSEFVDEVKTLK
jgi:hypothetical protein